MKLLSCILAFSFLTSCSNISVNDYANNTPTFIPEKFFSGKLTAHGIVKNRSGKIIRYFNADINAYWHNHIGTLEEIFTFNDGEIQYRTWKLETKTSNEKNLHYTATAGDVVGIAQGQAAGNAFNLQYVLAVKYESSSVNVSVNDWMWLTNETTLLNESTLTKFGFTVGTVQLTIIKHAND